ncbi:uncharacterized protein LOC106635741 isoform X2 [Copidosoma floridanum]|uniref:uncharacterized protein LOC106635741 isoform X2 n=1 Tax=Copidosoma floridanum TaxID=29053 RepID=UPI0006C94418|nr:uncharacterized protein LOC106635741 isoform X2 [Copidosoma floridanum]
MQWRRRIKINRVIGSSKHALLIRSYRNAPPGDEDEEEGEGVGTGVRNGYGQSKHHQHYSGERRERSSSSHHNGYGPPTSGGWLKSRHGSAGSCSNGSSGSNNGHQSAAGSTTSGYASGGSRSRRDDSSANGYSPGYGAGAGRQKIVFNEDEYTRITTPRQDMLFKKSYLAQRKPWTSGAASMSATPSTAESQSASHSTADGSEAAEDQQLLDGNVVGEMVMEPPPPLSYGTYYDHASGYYYECPMMLVGPAVPEPLAPNVLAAMPCGPVPLRPIEWVNPAFVPKLASQQYCYMDYQAAQGPDCAALVDTQGVPLSMAEPTVVSSAAVMTPATTNGLSHHELDSVSDSLIVESANGDAQMVDEETSLVDNNGVVTDDSCHHQFIPEAEQPLAELQELSEPLATTLETYEVLEPPEGLEYVPEAVEYVETLPAQPIHLGHHVVPQPLGQPYIYPGQYMFGPSVINVNGVTMQSAPMLRYSDVMASSADVACIKRRRKKKKKKQRRIPGNMDEDEEFSSEGENGYSCPRSSWTVAATTTTTLDFNSGNNISRPLNPECQEFHLRSPELDVYDDPGSESHVLAFEECTSSPLPVAEMNGNGEQLLSEGHESQVVPVLENHTNNELKRLTDEEPRATTATPEDEVAANGVTPLTNGDLADEVLANGDSQRLTESPEARLSLDSCSSSSSSRSSSTASPSRAKYNAKTLKYVREPTPGPELELTPEPEESPSVALANGAEDEERSVDDVTNMINSATIVEAQAISKDGDLDICQTWINESSITFESCCNENNRATTTTTMTTTGTKTITDTAVAQPAIDEDSGIESQPKPTEVSGRPISDAVNEWLKRVNSPDLFITSSATNDIDDDDDDEEDEELDAAVSNEPSKNLQGNPMPALSVNGVAEEREPSRGKFVSPDHRAGVDDDELPVNVSSKGKVRNFKGAKKKDAKGHRCNAKDLDDSCVERANKYAVAQDHTYISVTMIPFTKTSRIPLKRKIDESCEFTDEDSDAGMRVAKNSRINAKRAKGEFDSQEDDCMCKRIGDVVAVKTFEKGEIVVSMDGELLLVAPTLDEKMKKCVDEEVKRKNSNSTAEDERERSWGSIEEPDVLEYWEAETVEPVMTLQKMLQDESIDDDLLMNKDDEMVFDRMEHIQMYYRLQVVEDESSDSNAASNDEDSSAAPNIYSDQTTESISSLEEIEMRVTEIKAKSIGDDGSRVPIDEAFEAYESCYTDRSFPFAAINGKFDRSHLFNRDREGAVPCKAVCCNIQ